MMVQLTPGWTADACRESRPQEISVSIFDSVRSIHHGDVTSALPTANAEFLDPGTQQLYNNNQQPIEILV